MYTNDGVVDPSFLPNFVRKGRRLDLCVGKSEYRRGAFGYALLWSFGKCTGRASLQFRRHLGTSRLNSFRYISRFKSWTWAGTATCLSGRCQGVVHRRLGGSGNLLQCFDGCRRLWFVDCAWRLVDVRMGLAVSEDCYAC